MWSAGRREQSEASLRRSELKGNFFPSGCHDNRISEVRDKITQINDEIKWLQSATKLPSLTAGNLNTLHQTAEVTQPPVKLQDDHECG
jgi:hypothetical protein